MSAWPPARVDRLWPPAPRAWEIAWEVDFRSMSSQTLSNGALSLGGRSFTVANAANADTFRIEAGEGLEIEASSGTDYAQPSPSCPLVWIDLEDLLPDFSNADALFVQAEVDSSELAEADQGFGQGLGSTRGGLAGSQTKAELRYDSGVSLRVGRVWAGNDLGYSVSASGAAWLGQSWRTWCAETRWSSSPVRPAPQSMSVAAPTALAANGGMEEGDGYYFAAPWLRLWLFGWRGGGASAYTARWRSLRVWRQRFDRGVS